MAKQDNVKGWITINGVHIPLFDGDSKTSAVQRFYASKHGKDVARLSSTASKSKKSTTEKSKAVFKQFKPRVEDTEHDRKVVEKYKTNIKNNIHRPILVQKGTDEIIDGNHTFQAYKELNIVPPKLYIGDRKDFFKEVQKTNFNEIKAIENLIKDKKVKKW